MLVFSLSARGFSFWQLRTRLVGAPSLHGGSMSLRRSSSKRRGWTRGLLTAAIRGTANMLDYAALKSFQGCSLALKPTRGNPKVRVC